MRDLPVSRHSNVFLDSMGDTKLTDSYVFLCFCRAVAVNVPPPETQPTVSTFLCIDTKKVSGVGHDCAF